MAWEQNRPARFATTTLPWIITGVGLLVYLATLNTWVSLSSLRTVARLSGWSWQPELRQPLTCLVLYPFAWLPEPWIPLALNIFAAVCAALVLGLLARSVALLPHDVGPVQPARAHPGASPGVATPPSDGSLSLLTHHAWAPPTLAAVVCGWQLSFWEHATSFSGEMLDLLVFAYLIRCLLEFRIDRDQRWLSRSALVYGAGMANNWALIGYLPVFLAAILRLQGFGIIYNRRFLLRMSLWGLAGLGLYLLLPAVHSFAAATPMHFWTALKANLSSQMGALKALQRPALRVLALTSLLPLLVLSIRWKSHSVQLGDDSRLGVFLTKSTVHFVHALFLASSLWIALDPTFSPRNLDLGPPMLTYYYISALVGGYCAGYFLLLGSAPAAQGAAARRPPPARWKRASTWGVGTVYALLCIMPLALGWRNARQIGITNGPMVRDFARQLYADLPAGKSAGLSDEPKQLFLLRAELSTHGADKEALLVDASSLAAPQYHAFMARRFKTRWPLAAPTNRVERIGPGKVLKLVSAFAAREPVVYLHPSFSYLHEPFTERPHGLVHYLVPGLTNGILEEPGQDGFLAPDLSSEEREGTAAVRAIRNGFAGVEQAIPEGVAATNEQIWQQRWTNGLQTLAGQRRPKHVPDWAGPLLGGLRLAPQRNPTVAVLGAAYSKTLNYWGVQAQRLGRWPEAGVWFGRALELNPENLAARINAEYNGRCQRGDKTRLDAAATEKRFQDMFSGYANWREVLDANGPVDEPAFLFRTARVLLAGGNTRQAAREFARCAELAPDWPAPKLWLAESYNQVADFASALKVTESIRAENARPAGAAWSRLLDCRVTALQGLGRTNEAVACLEKFASEYGQHPEVLSVAAGLYARNGQFEQELALLEELLKREPDRPGLLSRKGLAELHLSRYEPAIAALSRALVLRPADEEARLGRAIAYLGAGQLDAARDDYQQLLKSPVNSPNALFGLGTIACRKHETNAAIQFYQQYLSKNFPALGQNKVAAERLKELRGGQAK